MTIAALVMLILIAVQAAPLTLGDRAAVEAATQAYREAWLSNDPQRIMATLTPDAVLYPSTLPRSPAARRSGSSGFLPHRPRAWSPWN